MTDRTEAGYTNENVTFALDVILDRTCALLKYDTENLDWLPL
jgi:hypothetical protein